MTPSGSSACAHAAAGFPRSVITPRERISVARGRSVLCRKMAKPRDLLMSTPLTRVVLLLVALAVGVRFVNRTADFPSGINWSGDIYTDEGWYNHAATEHVRAGAWYLPGDMNTSINHPIS